MASDEQLRAEAQAHLGAIAPPKRKARARGELQPLDEALGDDGLPRVRGVVLERDPNGWRAVEIELQASSIKGITKRCSEPDMAGAALATAEVWLGEVLRDETRTTSSERGDGILTPELAAEQLNALGAELRRDFWADAIDDGECFAALERFAMTGELEPASIGRKPTSADRGRLQELMRIAGAGK